MWFIRRTVKKDKKSEQKISQEEFSKISIRGRVAYGICCLENAMIKYNISGEGWNILLKRMWEYTTLSGALDRKIGMLTLEKWMNLTKFLPKQEYYYGAPNYKLFVERRVCYPEEPPTEDTYNKLFDSYHGHKNEVINKMCSIVFDIGSDEMYAGIDEKSKVTLDDLQEMLDIMYENEIPLPDIEPFRQYVFHKSGWDYDLHGWGEMFEGTQYSKFVNKSEEREVLRKGGDGD